MAGKELAKVRSKFVEKATHELINQLLDDLLDDGVLNEGEKDSVVKKNSSRADKARRLIHIVRKKGDEASRKMIAHLQRREPSLYSGQPAQPGKELSIVWRKFVKKATNEQIKQLLDDLLDDGVLNEGEKDSVLKENSSRADKARRLIHIVRKKGDEASRKMIDYLQSRDSSLHSELGLSSGQPAQPGKELLNVRKLRDISNVDQKVSIFEKNSSRADKASMHIDKVKEEGDEASRKTIAELQSRDSSLHSDVGLSSGQPTQPEPQKEQQWSTTLIRTREDSWKKKQNDGDIYPASKNSMSNRVALIITNMKFTDEKLNRNGAEKDEANMEELFTALGYEVVKHTNLTGKAINDALIEFSKHPKLKEADSVLVVIMSHGKLGTILGVNWKKEISDGEKPDVFPIDNIYKHLGPEKCPALLNKPKIIIIQACRGEEEGSVLAGDGANPAVVSDAADEENIESDGLQYVNKEKDYSSLLSCTPDTVSYRHTVHGSFLIQYVVEVLNTFAHEDDIMELFRKVMKRFEDFPFQTKRQMPTIDRCTLTKRFYFFPGL